MKLLTPSTLAITKGTNTVARISIARSGMFTISSAAAELMGLTKGDRIQFIEMGEKKEDDIFAIPVGKSGDGFGVRQYKELKFFVFSSSDLRRLIIDHFYPGKDFKATVTLLVGMENSLEIPLDPAKPKGKVTTVRAWPLLARSIV